MIRINLAPPNALKDKIWFVPELLFFLIITSSVYTGVTFFLKSIEDDTARIRAEIESINRDTENLNPDIQRFEQVTKQIESIGEKLQSLESLTVSKVGRYLPIILLEHLQKMKPEGLWFSTLRQESNESQIRISGGSFDNLLIAEFINSIVATRKRPTDPKDITSYIFFPNVLLDQIANDAADQMEMGAKSTEKSEKQKILQDTAAIKASGPKTLANETSEAFPELGKFPAFSVVLKYAERGDKPMRPETPAKGSP